MPRRDFWNRVTFGVAGVATPGQLFAGTRPAQAASGGAGAAVAHGPVKSGLREGSFEAAHALAWRGPVTDLPLSGPVETYDAVISGLSAAEWPASVPASTGSFRGGSGSTRFVPLPADPLCRPSARAGGKSEPVSLPLTQHPYQPECGE